MILGACQMTNTKHHKHSIYLLEYLVTKEAYSFKR